MSDERVFGHLMMPRKSLRIANNKQIGRYPSKRVLDLGKNRGNGQPLEVRLKRATTLGRKSRADELLRKFD